MNSMLKVKQTSTWSKIKETNDHPINNVIGNVSDRVLSRSQNKMDELSQVTTIEELQEKISRDGSGKFVDLPTYRSMVGSILYLMAGRQDKLIIQDFVLNTNLPKKSHLKVVKRIIMFVVGTYNLGLWYYTNIFVDIIFYKNVDWRWMVQRWEEHFQWMFLYFNCLITQLSKKLTKQTITLDKAYVRRLRCE